MREIFEEYGEFIIEAISGVLLLGILALFFFDSSLFTMIQKFITSVLGGGI